MSTADVEVFYFETIVPISNKKFPQLASSIFSLTGKYTHILNNSSHSTNNSPTGKHERSITPRNPKLRSTSPSRYIVQISPRLIEHIHHDRKLNSPKLRQRAPIPKKQKLPRTSKHRSAQETCTETPSRGSGPLGYEK